MPDIGDLHSICSSSLAESTNVNTLDIGLNGGLFASAMVAEGYEVHSFESHIANLRACS
jgi:hypothetical protein